MYEEKTEANKKTKKCQKRRKIEITNGTYILFPPKVPDVIHLNKISIKKKELIGQLLFSWQMSEESFTPSKRTEQSPKNEENLKFEEEKKPRPKETPDVLETVTEKTPTVETKPNPVEVNLVPVEEEVKTTFVVETIPETHFTKFQKLCKEQEKYTTVNDILQKKFNISLENYFLKLSSEESQKEKKKIFDSHSEKFKNKIKNCSTSSENTFQIGTMETVSKNLDIILTKNNFLTLKNLKPTEAEWNEFVEGFNKEVKKRNSQNIDLKMVQNDIFSLFLHKNIESKESQDLFYYLICFHAKEISNYYLDQKFRDCYLKMCKDL
jgi:hypothetical protein